MKCKCIVLLSAGGYTEKESTAGGGLVQQGILVIALRTNEPNKKIIGTICPFTNQNLKIKL